MDNKKAKTPKKKGPLRTGVLLPLALFLILVVVYMTYFFDNHLRRGLEFGGTYANGAEVNVGGLYLKWSDPSITISKIQVTNREKPTHNLVAIGRFKLELLWDGLLRGKFVIPDAAIQEIAANSQRKRPGRVLPQKKKSGDSKDAVSAAADKTIDQIAKKNEKNLLSDLMAVAGGTNYKDQLKSLGGQIASSEKIKVLEKELKAKEGEWKKKIDGLPKESELKKIEARVKGFKFDSSNPAKIKSSLKELETIYKDAQTKYKNIEGAKKAFSSDLKKYKSSYKDLETTIKNDIQAMSDKLNIPSLDPNEITQMLLGNLVAKHLRKIEKYKNMAREYMPEANSKDERIPTITPQERKKGRNFRFLKAKAYPKFWLKNIALSSKSNEGEFSGDVEGTIKNVTDAPSHLGLPATANLKGSFPKQEIFDIVADITVDHTTELAKESAKITVGKFPVEKNHLSQSSDVEFGYNSALGSSAMDVSYEGGLLQIDSKSLFKQVDYFVDAKSKRLLSMLTGVTKDLQNIDLNIKAKGSWEDLSLHINSNLGRKISEAIKKQINAQVEKAKKDVEAHVRGLVGKEKEKLNGELAKIEKKFGVDLKNKDAAVQSIKTSVDKMKNEAKNKEKKKIEGKAKKELDKLKKKFKLPF